ncbi:uncharacterized protein LOC103938176 isoform X2 [Pyrus x bretschneideri]|uniref:uncharacterized protein LOC103938176 isoform X2 n=1 Tax=Pyrus x bretschneideri TaxID=225117 RepID=UPI00202DE950|nr:uncharacterized protein LOC103938176 isoform X2 [Pyrus x bretschneideri]
MAVELVELCIQAASESRDSVEKWRRQRRSLERLPPQLADSLLRRLISRRLLFPSLLELFKNSVEEVDLRGESSVDAEWIAYLGAFRYLRSLNVSDCRRLTASALWPITGMESLRELDFSRCSKVTDAGIRHLLSITTLEKLCISETGVSANGVMLLALLRNLSLLDLGGLPVTDQALSSLQVLTKLQYLDLWGSKISDKGAALLQAFPKLSFTSFNCTIRAPLAKLIVSGATFGDEFEAFHDIEKTFLTFLDLSNSSLQKFYFLSHLNALEHLDLSSSTIGDDWLELIARIGVNLKYLNLSRTRVSSAGVGVVTGHVPNLEFLSVSHTLIDDVAVSYISMMPSVKFIDLSNTNIKGVIHQVEPESASVLSLSALQSLRHLEKLNLKDTKVTDAALDPLKSFHELTDLTLKSASLTDNSLYYTSSIPKLTNLCVHDGVLTNSGLNSYKPPLTLRMMDLSGCWLLTEDAISSFCKAHPQIELRHELVHISPSKQIVSNSPSSSRSNRKASQAKQKQQENVPVLPGFLDQRLKYSREELLALQYSSLSLVPPPDQGAVLPNTESD